MNKSELAVALALKQGARRQIEIARELKFSKQRVHSLVRKLQKYGVVLIQPNGRVRLQPPITDPEFFSFFHDETKPVFERFGKMVDKTQARDGDEVDVVARVFRAMLEVWGA